MDEKLNQQNLIDYLIEKNDLQPEAADKFVQEFFQLIEDGLKKDSVVKIKGLGTFKLVDVESRESINVNTGERFMIQGHTKVSFTPDNNVRDIINKPFAHFETVVLNDEGLAEETPTFEEESADDDDFVTGIEVVSISNEEEVLEQDEEESPDKKVIFTIMNQEEEKIDESDENQSASLNDSEHFLSGNEKDEEEPEINEKVFNDEVVLAFLSGDGEGDSLQSLSDIFSEVKKTKQPKLSILDEKIYFKRKRKENTFPPPPIPEPEVNPILPPKPTKSHSNTFLVAAIIVLLVVCGGVVFYLYNPDFIDDMFTKRNQNQPIAQVVPVDTLEEEGTGDDNTLEEITFEDPVQKRRTNPTQSTTTARTQDNVVRRETSSTRPQVNNTRPRNTTSNAPASGKRILQKPNLTEYQIMNDNSPVSPDYNSYEIIGTMGNHRLKSNETLTRVSLRFYGTKNLWPYIARYNGISDPGRISVGKSLKIPQLQEK